MNEVMPGGGRGCGMKLDVKSKGSHASMKMCHLGCQLWLTMAALWAIVVHLEMVETHPKKRESKSRVIVVVKGELLAT